jgi:hypothetical protein
MEEEVMARIIKSQESFHLLTIRSDRNDGELLLIGGHRPYLWAGNAGGPVTLVSGNKTLRMLAKAILKATKP